jgi:hypothetical protein
LSAGAFASGKGAWLASIIGITTIGGSWRVGFSPLDCQAAKIIGTLAIEGIASVPTILADCHNASLIGTGRTPAVHLRQAA